MAKKNGGGDPPAEEEEEEDKNHGGADGGASPQKETDDDGEKKKKKKHSDPELLMCLLQPCPADSDPEYIGIRRLLLSRKSQSSILRRLVSFSISIPNVFIHFRCELSLRVVVVRFWKDWRCNGKGYVAFRNYIRRPRDWEKDSLRTPSLQTTPGNR